MNIYCIGGSPCSGKSTVADILARRYHLTYVKADDSMARYQALGIAQGAPVCQKLARMSADEIWMRAPDEQCREELAFYEEIFPFVIGDLRSAKGSDIITEGAAYMPRLMRGVGFQNNRYVCLTPEKRFQIEHYKKREWVPYILKECRDKDAAFANWMDRDALFALEVQKQASDAQYLSIVNDGQIGIEHLAQTIAQAFGLSE